MRKNKMGNCKNCEYWIKNESVKRKNCMDYQGECRRTSPDIDRNGFGVWPMTSESDFCGKFKKKYNALNEMV